MLDDALLTLLAPVASSGVFAIFLAIYLFRIVPAKEKLAAEQAAEERLERAKLSTTFSSESEKQRDLFRDEAGEQRELYREEQVAARDQHEKSLDKLIVVLVNKKKE